MAKHALTDDSIIVVIGSGAGGGTLANELCQKGFKDVLLEAGQRQSSTTFNNEEWFAFNQLAWLDKRTTSGTWRVAKDFPNLPAWICKTVGGTTTHWAGASLRLQEHEFKAKTHYSGIDGANLLDWPLSLSDLEPYYAKAESKMGVTRTNDIQGLPGNNNFKVMYNGATRVGYKTVHTGRMAINSQPRDMNHVLTVADVQGIVYIRSQTPEYLRHIERGALRSFLEETQYVSLVFGGTLAVLGYWIGQFIGRYLAVWPIRRYLKTV